jgi:hypothetical protein
MPVFLVLVLFVPVAMHAQNAGRNSRPTLDRIPDYSTRFSTDLHYIEVSGITAGDESDQELTISVSSGDDDFFESLEADLVGNSNAFINYRLKKGAVGTATVKVIVTDDGYVPASITRIFRITCEPLNHELSSKYLYKQESVQYMRAYPNPAGRSARVYFSTPHNEQRVAVDMYTLVGTKVRQLFTGSTVANESYAVDVNSALLANGVYLIRLTGHEHTEMLKLVVSK